MLSFADFDDDTGPAKTSAAPVWVMSGPGKVFQTLGQSRGEASRREMVAGTIPEQQSADEAFKQAAVTLWSLSLDGHKADNFAAKEGVALPLLTLLTARRVEKALKVSSNDDWSKGGEAGARETLEKARAAGDAAMEAEALLRLAAVQLASAPTSSAGVRAAFKLVQDALAICKANSNRSMEASALNMLANAHLLLGEARDCIRVTKEALAIIRLLGGNKLYEVPLLQTLASAWFVRRDPDEALRALKEVHALCDGAGKALAQACVAQAHLANDEQPQALSELESAIGSLKGDADGEIAALGVSQELAVAVGKPLAAVKAAQDLLGKEKKRGVKEGIARALGLVASSDPTGKDAVDSAQQAAKQFKDLGDKTGEGIASVLLAAARLSQGKLSDAGSASSDALAAFQAASKPVGEAFAHSAASLVSIYKEEASEAEKLGREALVLFQDGGHRIGQFLGNLLIRKAQQIAMKPTEAKVVIDEHHVAHVEISGICTPKSMEAVLNALHQARCGASSVRAIVLHIEGAKGAVPAGCSYPASEGHNAAPHTQSVASGGFLLGLRTLGIPTVAAISGKIAGPAYGLVLAADYRIAASSTTFLLPLWGPPECLGDMLGHTAAMQLCYHTGPASALSMLEYGVIHQCQKGLEDTRKAASEVARRMASTPNLACHSSTTMLSPAVEKYATLVSRGGIRA